jgi:hypothetical protein
LDDLATVDTDTNAALDQIDTDWSLIHEPAHVVLRYAQAIQRYLRVIIAHQHDAEEVAQDFLLWVSQHGLPRASKDRGRFRDYLKKVVRNAALNFLRRTQSNKARRVDFAHVSALITTDPRFERAWIHQWRQCLLDRALTRLKKHEHQTRDNWAYTVLELRLQHPDDDSAALAEKATHITKRPFRAESYRKQVSRARRLFAQMLVKEVAQTLTAPEPHDVENELADLGLMVFVRDYLPLRRRTSS